MPFLDYWMRFGIFNEAWNTRFEGRGVLCDRMKMSSQPSEWCRKFIFRFEPKEKKADKTGFYGKVGCRKHKQENNF